ncbi:hypothetical protein PGRAN_09461 [Listeria grandensis FSL F6-0971]|uniref:Modifier protein of major autolysin LytC n=1 Tax=Listeria grandensis FSL F6-0971 TaxID=1265819 RepID=W7B795_9LIST|nr:Ig-like domain-containing protein [Listeria grandensis]EUJ23149.1 hypothetical protein PGRAN_09461 [Listeria grandensis FSL F6-0971]
MKNKKVLAGMLAVTVAGSQFAGAVGVQAAENITPIKQAAATNTTVVTTFAQLQNVLTTGSGDVSIALGNNITLEKGTTVSKNITSLTIDGQGYTLTENTAGAAAGTIYIGNAATKTVTMKNMNIVGKNYYGPVNTSDSLRGITLNYQDVTYTGPQIIHNVGGYANFSGDNHVTITKVFSTGDKAQEFSEATGVNVSGKLVIDHGGTSDSTFWFGYANYVPTFLNIEDDAEVSVLVRNTDMFYLDNSATKPFSLTVGKNAKFDVVTNKDLFRTSSMGAKNMTFGEGSETTMTRHSTKSKELINLKSGSNPGTMVVNKGAKVKLNNETGPVVSGSSNSSISLNDPDEVTFQGNIGSLLKYSGAFGFSAQNVKAWNNSTGAGVPMFTANHAVDKDALVASGVATGTGAVNITTTNDNSVRNIPFTAAGTLTFSSDATVIAAPKVDTVTNMDTVVKGTGESGKKVNVKLPNGSVYTGTVDDNGNYSVAIPKQEIGATISVWLSDTGGNVSPTATTKVIASTIPATLNDITDQSKSITGTTVPNADFTLKITTDGVPVRYTGSADSTGKILVNLDKSPEAGATVELQTTKDGASSNVISKTVKDVTPPDAPFVSPVLNTDIVVTGTGEIGATATVKLPNGSEADARVGQDGKFSVAIPAQAVGAVLEVTLTDAAGNESEPTKVTVAANVIAATLNDITDKSTSITGTTVPNADFIIKVTTDGTTVKYEGQADGTGKILVSLDKTLKAGATVELQATKGGASSQIVTKTVQDVTAPEAPVVSPVLNTDTTVKGTGEVGATATATLPNGSKAEAVVGMDGKFSITIPAQAVGSKISVTLTDAANNTSAATEVTVGSSILDAPTINEYTVADGFVVGRAPAGASRIALYVGDRLVRYGAIDANGGYQIYAADHAKMQIIGTVFQVAAVDANGTVGTKASSTVKANIAAPSVKDFYVGDVYAKGTAVGSTKVTLFVNDKAIRTAAVAADGTYSIYTGDQASLASAGNKFQIQGTSADNKVSAKTTATVKSKLAAPLINKYVVSDVYAKGTATGGAEKVALYIDGKLVRTAAVNPDGTFLIYTGDQTALRTAGKAFQIAAIDGAGTEGPKATATVQTVLAAPTILAYYPTDVYAKGTAPANATRVALYVNDKFVRYAPVTAGAYSIYTGDQASLTAVGNTFQIAAVDANGSIGTKATGTVKEDNRVAYTLTANEYNMAADQDVSGTHGTGITRVKLEVAGEVKRQTTTSGGTYAIYAKDVITSTTQKVELVGYDAQGFERNRVTVSVKNEAPQTYNINADVYNTVTDEYVKGDSDMAITRIKLVVNGKDARSTTVTGGAYQIYAQDKISSASDMVEIVAYDVNNIERNRITVSVVSLDPAAKKVTPNDYTFGTDSVTGSFGSDVKKVQLFVDGAFARQAALTGNTFTVYAKDKVTSKTQLVEVVGFDAAGLEISRQAVTIK